MKEFVLENGLTGLVRELVENGCDVDGAIEHVYDAHTMTAEQFKAKYIK